MDQFSATTTHYLNTLGPKSNINFKNSSEVDLSLISTNYDLQTHAIAWVPHHLNQHPNPVTINEWVTKLTRQFANSTSPIKLLIIEVFKKIQPQLVKCISIDIIFQNLVSLLNTGREISIEDQVLTLRVLKSIHIIIKDNLKYHQLILNLFNTTSLFDLNEELIWTCLESIESIAIDSNLGRDAFLDLIFELSKSESNYQVTAIQILRHYGNSSLFKDVYDHCTSLFYQISPEDNKINANSLRFALVSTLTRITQTQPQLVNEYSIFLKKEFDGVNDSSYLRIIYDNLVELLKDGEVQQYFKNTSINNEWLLLIQNSSLKCNTSLNETKYLMTLKYLLKLRIDKIEGLEWNIKEMKSTDIKHLPNSLYTNLYSIEVAPIFSRALISNQLLTRLLIMQIDKNQVDTVLPFLKLNQSKLFKFIQPQLAKDKLILVLRSLKYQIQFILKIIKHNPIPELIEIIVGTLIDLLIKFGYQKELENSKLLDRWIDSLIPQLLEFPNLIQALQTELNDKNITNIRLIRLGLLTFSTFEITEQSPTRSDKITLPKVPLLDKLLSITIPNSIHIPILIDCFKLHFLRGHYPISYKIITIVKQYQPTVSNQLQRLILNWSQLTEFEIKWHQKNFQNSASVLNYTDLECIINQLKQFNFLLLSWTLELRIIYLKAMENLFIINTKLILNSFQVKKIFQNLKKFEELIGYWCYLRVNFGFWFNLDQNKWIDTYIENLKSFTDDCINQYKLVEYSKYYKLNVIVNDLEQLNSNNNGNNNNGINNGIKMEVEDFKPLNSAELEELSSNFLKTLKLFYENSSLYPPIFFNNFNNLKNLKIELPPYSTYNPNNLYTIEYAKDHRLILRFNGSLQLNNHFTKEQQKTLDEGNLYVKINTFETRKFINFNATSLSDQFEFYKLGNNTSPSTQLYLVPVKLNQITMGGTFECEIVIQAPTNDNEERVKLRLNTFENTLFWNLGFRFSLVLVNNRNNEEIGFSQSILSLIRFRYK